MADPNRPDPKKPDPNRPSRPDDHPTSGGTSSTTRWIGIAVAVIILVALVWWLIGGTTDVAEDPVADPAVGVVEPDPAVDDPAVDEPAVPPQNATPPPDDADPADPTEPIPGDPPPAD